MENNPKVIVLMSSYNGEKYIEDQLDSILDQTYDNFEIYVRDDGSKDNTLNILKKYEKEGKIKLFIGENIGYVKSFFWLIRNSSDADFYSFSDQDDVWLSDKIEKGINLLKNSPPEIPTLYFSNYDFYDSNMNFIKHNKPLLKKPNLFNTLKKGENGIGCTEIINQKLKETIC
ncbi:MAG TPA: glycosyltransferase, partial [Spirochaetota bacterium]|nr:glycosyltransferase [Spirochaetota bacterium]